MGTLLRAFLSLATHQCALLLAQRPDPLGVSKRRLPIHTVMELADHTSMETTRKFYLAITVDDMAAARKAAEDAIKGV